MFDHVCNKIRIFSFDFLQKDYFNKRKAKAQRACMPSPESNSWQVTAYVEPIPLMLLRFYKYSFCVSILYTVSVRNGGPKKYCSIGGPPERGKIRGSLDF
jgi:hypothetical protein